MDSTIYHAIHLELIQSLWTEGFLLGLRRFIARRGRPRKIYSDNGTNFIGADNLMASLDWKKITQDTSILRIQWSFNPHSPSWWGEAVINSRPLNYLSEDPDDLTPLTPSMFLQDIKTVEVPDLDNIDNINFTKRLRYQQRLRNDLRNRFRDEYLSLLVHQVSNKTGSKEVRVGDVVLIGCDNKKRLDQPMELVMEVFPGRDNSVRVVKIKTRMGELVRPVKRLYPLELNSASKIYNS
ncbi:pro-Pol polyprotein [Trichonephila clavipes]|nr:pro-Pol polyprotein [Trichonephila clavipes]